MLVIDIGHRKQAFMPDFFEAGQRPEAHILGRHMFEKFGERRFVIGARRAHIKQAARPGYDYVVTIFHAQLIPRNLALLNRNAPSSLEPIHCGLVKTATPVSENTYTRKGGRRIKLWQFNALGSLEQPSAHSG